jgi:uncharacterized RDD family membrane protein YckC
MTVPISRINASALMRGYPPYFNRTFAYEIYYYGIYFYKQFTQAPTKSY